MHPNTTSRSRGLIAAISASVATVVVAAAAIASPASAATGDRYKFYGTYSSGTAVTASTDGGTARSVTPRTFSLQAQTSGVDSVDAYAATTSGTSPHNNANVDYTVADWTLPARGGVEWILKNSYPTKRNYTLASLRADVYANDTTVGTGTLSAGDAIAATQAAIWALTDGTELAATTSARIKAIAKYLLDGARAATETSPTPPTVALASPDNRTSFSVAPDGVIGPFTVTSSHPVTLTASTGAQVVNAAGTALTGAQPTGTEFYLRPTATPTADGSATVSATTGAITSQIAQSLTGSFAGAARQTLVALGSVTGTGTTSATYSWVVDRTGAGSFDPNGSETTRSYTYNRPGTTSVTLEDVVFTDGSRTKTDLLRLQGPSGGNAYSVDAATIPFNGTLTDQTKFTEKDWAEGPGLDPALQDRVAWILKNSYPERSLANLTADARAAGFYTASGNVRDYIAYAATQAALWSLTTGKTLDTTRYDNPISATVGGAVIDLSAGWQAQEPGTQTIEFTFPQPLEISNYDLTRAVGGTAPTKWWLEQHGTGGWTTVSTSTHNGGFTGDTARTQLGGSATIGGKTVYRLVLQPANHTDTVAIGGVAFHGLGVIGTGPNASRVEGVNLTGVVEVYNYLLASSRQAPAAPTTSVALTSDSDSYARQRTSDPIGPFTLTGDTAAVVTANGAELAAVGSTERTTSLQLSAGTEFIVFPGTAESGTITLHAHGSAVNFTTARSLVATTQGGHPVLTELGVQTLIATADFTATYAPVVAALTLDADSVTHGGSVGAQLAGFLPGETVSVTAGDVVLASTTVDAAGAATVVPFVVTDAIPAGDVTITATGAESGRAPEATLTVNQVLIVTTPPTLTLSASSVAQGETIALSGIGFGDEEITIELHSDPIALGSVTAAGSFATTVTVPASAPVGAHNVVVTGVTSGLTTSQPITVTAAETNGPKQPETPQKPTVDKPTTVIKPAEAKPAEARPAPTALPATGTDALPIALFALFGIIIAGGGLLLRSRRSTAE